MAIRRIARSKRDREDERRDVDEVRPREADLRDEHSGDDGPDEASGAAEHGLQRGGRRDLLALDQHLHRGTACRYADRVAGRREEEHDEDHPSLRVRRCRVGCEHERAEQPTELGEQQDPAALEVVRDRTADDRAEEQREHRDEPEQADGERRPGQVVDLERSGDPRELRARGRDAVSAPQERGTHVTCAAA